MPVAGYEAAAAELKRSNPGLRELIQFVRTYDPTEDLVAAWGANYKARLDFVVAKARDTYVLGKEFPGSPVEVLLVMAHHVTVAPYVGTPESQVASFLRNMLMELP